MGLRIWLYVESQILKNSRKYELVSLRKPPTEGISPIVPRVVNRTYTYNPTLRWELWELTLFKLECTDIKLMAEIYCEYHAVAVQLFVPELQSNVSV